MAKDKNILGFVASTYLVTSQIGNSTGMGKFLLYYG